MPEIIGGIKSRISVEWIRECEREGMLSGKIWQRSYHDHIIRDERDYLRIWQYIDENPARWERDCFYVG